MQKTDRIFLSIEIMDETEPLEIDVDRFYDVDNLRKKIAEKKNWTTKDVILRSGNFCSVIMTDGRSVWSEQYIQDEITSKFDVTAMTILIQTTSETDNSKLVSVKQIKSKISELYHVDLCVITALSQHEIQFKDEELIDKDTSVSFSSITCTVNLKETFEEDVHDVFHNLKVSVLRTNIANIFQCLNSSVVKLTTPESIIMEDNTVVIDSRYKMPYFKIKAFLSLQGHYNISKTENINIDNYLYSTLTFMFEKENFDHILGTSAYQIVNDILHFLIYENSLKSILDSKEPDRTFIVEMIKLFPEEENKNILKLFLKEKFISKIKQFIESGWYQKTITIEKVMNTFQTADLNTWTLCKTFLEIPVVKRIIKPTLSILAIQDMFNDSLERVDFKFEPIIPMKRSTSSFFTNLSRSSLKLLIRLRLQLIDENVDFEKIRYKLTTYGVEEKLEIKNPKKLRKIFFGLLLTSCDDDDLKCFLWFDFADEDSLIRFESEKLMTDPQILDASVNVDNLTLPPWPKVNISRKFIDRKSLSKSIQDALTTNSDPNIILLYGQNGSGKTNLCWQLLTCSEIINYFPGGILFLHKNDTKCYANALRKILHYFECLEPIDPVELKSKKVSMSTLPWESVCFMSGRIKSLLNNYHWPRFLVILDNLISQSNARRLVQLPLHFLITSSNEQILDSSENVFGNLKKVKVNFFVDKSEEDELWNLQTKNKQEKRNVYNSMPHKSLFIINLMSTINNVARLTKEIDKNRLVLYTNDLIQQLLVEMNSSYKEKYLFLKVFSSDSSISPFLMTILWNFKDEEEAKILLNYFCSKNLLEKHFEKCKETQRYYLHSSLKAALSSCPSCLSIEDYWKQIFENFKEYCKSKWYKLPNNDATLWRLLMKSCKQSNICDDDFCQEFLCDLRVISNVVDSLGLDNFIRKILMFIKKLNLNDENKEFLKQLHRFLYRHRWYFTSNLRKSKENNQRRIIELALREQTRNSLIRKWAKLMIANEELCWFPQNFHGGDNIEKHLFDCHSKICGVISFPLNKVTLIITKECQLYCYSLKEINICQLPKSSIEGLLHIEGMPTTFATVSRKSQLEIYLQFYHLIDFLNPNQKNKPVQPMADVTINCIEIYSIVYQKRDCQTVFYIAGKSNSTQITIYQLIYQNKFIGKASTVLNYPIVVVEPTPADDVRRYKHTCTVLLFPMDKRIIWSIWNVNNQHSFMQILDGTIVYERQEFNSNWQHVCFFKTNEEKQIITVIFNNQYIVYDHQLIVMEQSHCLACHESFHHLQATIVQIAEKYKCNFLRVVGLNLYLFKKNEKTFTQNFAHENSIFTDCRIYLDNKKPSLKNILLWTEIGADDQENKIFQLVAIDSEDKLVINKMKIVEKKSKRKKLYELSELELSTSQYELAELAVDYVCCQSWTQSLNSIVLLLFKKQNDVENDNDSDSENDIIVLHLTTPTTSSQSHSQLSNEEQNIKHFSIKTKFKREKLINCWFDLQSKRLAVAGREENEIEIAQYFNGQVEGKYFLYLQQYTDDILFGLYNWNDSMSIGSLSVKCHSEFLSYPVLVRILAIKPIPLEKKEDLETKYFMETSRLTWNSSLQQFQASFSFIVLNENSLLDLQTCSCQRIFAMKYKNRIEIWNLFSLQILIVWNFDDEIPSSSAFHSHADGTTMDCNFAFLKKKSQELVVCSINKDDQIQEYKFVQLSSQWKNEEEFSPNFIQWSRNSNYLFVNNQQGNFVRTFRKMMNEEDESMNEMMISNELWCPFYDGNCVYLSSYNDLFLWPAYSRTHTHSLYGNVEFYKS